MLAQGIARELHRLIAGGADPVLLQRGLDNGVQTAVAALERLSIPLTEPEHVAGVARAVIEDPQVAQLLAEMIDVLGPYGNILIQPGYGLGHTYGFREGSRFPGEYISRYLLSDKFRRVAALDGPHVVVADFHFEEPRHVLHLLDLVTQAGGDKLFIICKNMWERAIDALLAANSRGPVTAYAARIKPVEDLRRDMMRDFALLTGAGFITDVAGMGPQDLTAADLGRAERLVATGEYLSLVGGGGDAQSLDAQTAALQSRLALVEEREERELLRERIGRLQGGIGELRVGAYTESERNALVERAAHAVKVVQVGLEGGVVPGGGAAYLDAIPAVEAAATGHSEEAMAMRAPRAGLGGAGPYNCRQCGRLRPAGCQRLPRARPGARLRRRPGLRARHDGRRHRGSDAGREGGPGAGGQRRRHADFRGGPRPAPCPAGELQALTAAFSLLSHLSCGVVHS